MKFNCRIGDREIKLSLDSSGEEFRMSSPEANGSIDFKRIAPGIFHLIEGSKSHLLAVSKVGTEYRVYLDGRLFPVKVETATEVLRRKHSGKSATRKNAGKVSTPIPGTVVRIYVSPGDAVEHGEPLLSLEAMKMENEIKSPISGIIREVPITEGESIAADALLVIIE